MGDKPDRAALNRMAGARLLEQGEQLGFFGDDQGAVVAVERRGGPGRPAGSGNKLKAKVREYLTAKGYRDPAEQLAMLAGLDRPDLHPLGYAAQMASALGEDVAAVAGLMRQAAAELMPYWHPKLTADISVNAPSVNILMQGAGGAVGLSVPGGDDPFAPLDVRLGLTGEIVEDQGLGDDQGDGTDGGLRTEWARS